MRSLWPRSVDTVRFRLLASDDNMPSASCDTRNGPRVDQHWRLRGLCKSLATQPVPLPELVFIGVCDKMRLCGTRTITCAAPSSRSVVSPLFSPVRHQAARRSHRRVVCRLVSHTFQLVVTLARALHVDVLSCRVLVVAHTHPIFFVSTWPQSVYSHTLFAIPDCKRDGSTHTHTHTVARWPYTHTHTQSLDGHS